MIKRSASPALANTMETDNPGASQSAGGTLTLEKFTQYMDKKVLVQIIEVRKHIDRVAVQVDTHTQQINAIQEDVDALRMMRIGSAPGGDGCPERRRYDVSRRSIRVWPVRGKDEEEIWKNIGYFIHDTLKVPQSDMSEEKIEFVRRLRSSNRGPINNEVLITFFELEDRDTVTSYARNLSEAIDSKGQPKAGLRMDIPAHLMSVFKTLESYGRQLRMKYGEDFKRHVRFDDTDRSLFLNVRFPGEDTWSRISPDLASKMISELENSHKMRDKYSVRPTAVSQSSNQQSLSDLAYGRRPRKMNS